MPEVVFARDGLTVVGRWLAERGARHALVLAPPSKRHVDRLRAALEAAGLAVSVFDGARVHVPREVLDAASARLAETGADAIVAIGGGAAVGLGKALRLHTDVRWVAVPTTYAGSEMTSIYGVTERATKTTGRDGRVRPELVIYDPDLTAGLPLGITIQSLLNALAHAIGTLGTGSLVGDDRAAALDTIGAVVGAVEALLADPDAASAREAAMRAASAAGVAADRGRFGAHHALAHLLGGRFDLDHAALHAILLPGSVARLRATDPALVAEVATAAFGATGRRDLEVYLREVLTRAGAPTSLDTLGAGAQALLVACHAAIAARALASSID